MTKIISIIPFLFITIFVKQSFAQDNNSEMLNNHEFKVILDNDISLEVKMPALENWKDAQLLTHFDEKVLAHISYFQDSIEQLPVASHNLRVTTDVNKDYEKLEYSTVPATKSETVFKNGNYHELKTAFDKLEVLEHINQFYPIEDGDKKAPFAISYVFHAKSLNDLAKIEPNTLVEVRSKIDSLVTKAELAVKNPKANWYKTNSTIVIAGVVNSATSTKLRFGNRFNNIKLGVGYGITVYNNRISPSIDLSLAYTFDRNSTEYYFAGLNMHQFYAIDKDEIFNAVYSTFNLEMGSARNKTGLMQSKSSLGFGLLLKQEYLNERRNNKYLFNMNFNYAISNTVSTSILFGSNFKKENNEGIFAISLKYNL